MADEQRLIPGITKAAEEKLIAELDGILTARDKIAAYRLKLGEHKEAARKMLKEAGKDNVVHGGHTFARETEHKLSVNKLKKEGKAKKSKKGEESATFTPKSAAAS